MINNQNGMERAVAEKQTQVGGDWFFWIAGLSVVNAILLLIRAPFGFFFGLGLPDLVVRSGMGLSAWIAVTLIAAGVFALFGYFARRGARWAFLAGMVFYVLDALACFSIKEYLEAAVHLYALFRIFQGFQAAQRLSLLPVSSAGYPTGSSVPPSSDVWPPPPST